jgi:hypothetical protein
MNRRLTGPGAWTLYFITAMLMVFILAPLAVVVAMSVSDSYFVSFPPQGFTLKWYVQILQDRDFLAALKLSCLLALSTTIGSLLLGVPAAIALTRASFPGQTLLKGLVLSPLIFPALVTGLALMQLLSAMGSGDARINLLIGHIVVTSPYVIRAVVTSLLLVDFNLEDAARTLGANLLAHHPAADRAGRRGRRAVRLHGLVRQLPGDDVAGELRVQPGAARPDAPAGQRLRSIGSRHVDRDHHPGRGRRAHLGAPRRTAAGRSSVTSNKSSDSRGAMS